MPHPKNKKCMAKKNICCNTPNASIWQGVKTDSPLVSTTVLDERKVYITGAGVNNVDTALAFLRSNHPTLIFESSNPGGNPPNPPGT